MYADTNTVPQADRRAVPWNKGKLLGQKPPLKLKEIWAIGIRLQTDCDRRFWRSQSSPVRLHLSLLCDLERVVDLNPEVSHGALKLGVAK